MNKNFIISPSIMCSTPADMEPYAHAFEASGIDAIHFDVMDGHYVPNIMLGVRDYAALKKATKLPIDLHLMCTDPEGFVQILQPAEGDWVSFHPETARNPHRLLMDLKARGCKAGIALSPGVPVSYIDELGTYLDFVLVMAVNPGFAGQKIFAHAFAFGRLRSAAGGQSQDHDQSQNDSQDFFHVLFLRLFVDGYVDRHPAIGDKFSRRT